MSEATNKTENTTVLEWNGSHWTVKSSGSTLITNFIFTDLTPENENNLGVAILEWNGPVLNLRHLNDEAEKVFKIQFNRTEKTIAITIENTTYRGPTKQIMYIKDNENAEKEVSKISEIVNFIKDYKFDAGYKNVSKKRGPPSSGTPRRQPKERKIIERSASEIDREVLENLSKSLTLNQLPEPEVRSILISQIDFKTSLEVPCENKILDHLKRINENTKIFEKTPFFTVVKKGERYILCNELNRFQAIVRFNSSSDNKISTIKCFVFHDLSFDQECIVSVYQNIQTQKTILEKLKLVKKIVENHSLAVTNFTKKEEESFDKLMNVYFQDCYESTCTKLIQLPDEIITKLFNLESNNKKLEHLDLDSKFWLAFIDAFDKNQEGALRILENLKEDTIKDSVKNFKKLEVNLLTYLSKQGPHNFQTEAEAINFFSNTNSITKSEFLTVLKTENFLKNWKRTSLKSKDYDWDKLKQKLKKYFKKDETTKTNYIEIMEESFIAEQNFIMINELPNKEVLEKISKYHQNFIILSIAQRGCSADKFIDSYPSATFEIKIENLVEIDKMTTVLPKATVPAQIFIPNAPDMPSLLSLAMTKNVPLADIINIEHVYVLTKLASEFKNALIIGFSPEITEQLISQLNFYENVHVYKKTAS